ncbi:MAG: hypothetical protein JKX92_12530 [Porticoccaceae bacterium]|nr:hypothetical protein [Porticoccaceae bacterium]
MKLLRYVFVVVVACLAWFLVFVASIKSLGITAILFCPEGHGGGGDCYVYWWKYVRGIYMFVGAGLSALVTIVAVVAVSKENKAKVALLTYICGMLIATLIAYVIGFWLIWGSAALIGYFTVSFIKRRHP